jgi:uncharacterized protein (TIGR03437 family)
MLIRTLSLLLFLRLAFAAPAPSFPVLTYSTYLRDSFTPKAIATDSSGNIYLAGNAIVDPGTLQSTVLVVKLNPQASQYVYVRYLGGSVNDSASAIAVDAAGNVYVAGSTASPDFPVSSGGHMGTAPTSPSDQRSFVAKLDANGNVVFSDLLGGSAASAAQAIAVNAAGQVVVTGMVNATTASGATGPGFPSTAGAYSIPNTFNHPYLLELDATGTKVVFSATGIGGSALALDSSGNIFVAGTTYLLDYPTTPGAYQSAFAAFNLCFAQPCMSRGQGANQYVTKVDPTGSKLVFSTAVSGSGSTTNNGLAVDGAGNVYLTGYAGESYPYTVVTPFPALSIDLPPFWALPFLSKLDPTGQTLLFSVPAGGAGVQLGSNATVFVGGDVGSIPDYAVAIGPALANVPGRCVFNVPFIHSPAYVSQLDDLSGDLLGLQFIGGSTLSVSGIAVFGSTVWLAGATTLPDVPFTPNTLTIPNLGPGSPPGAYLGAVDFSQPEPPAGTPQIGCIVDSADLAPVTAAVPYQLLTIFGTGLGPSTGVSATDNSTTTLAGVSVSVGGLSAPLLYVSSTQINFAVPVVSPFSATMQLTVNGLNAQPRQLPVTYANPSLFLSPVESGGVLALNANGSLNSVGNPALLGSNVSVFVNGLTSDPRVISGPLQLYTNNGWSVTDIVQETPFVLRVDLRVPSPLVNDFSCSLNGLCSVDFTLSDLSIASAGQAVTSVGLAFGGTLFVYRPQ